MVFGGGLVNFELSLAWKDNVVHAQSREAQALLSHLAPSILGLSNTRERSGKWYRTLQGLDKWTYTGSNVPYVPLAALMKMVVDVSMEGDAKDAIDRLLAVARGNDAGWELEQQRAREAAAAGARPDLIPRIPAALE